MRAPAGPRMVVPRPERWNADLDLHLAAQALPCAMPAGALPNAFTVTRLMSHLREDYSVPQEDVLSATAARTAQLYTKADLRRSAVGDGGPRRPGPLIGASLPRRKLGRTAGSRPVSAGKETG